MSRAELFIETERLRSMMNGLAASGGRFHGGAGSKPAA